MYRLPNLPTLEPMLTMEQVRKLIPLSHCQIYRLMKVGDFPRQVKIGPKRVAWHYQEIQDWIASRERGQTSAPP